MKKKNYIVTPQLMAEFNIRDRTPWGDEKTNFTGFVFLSKVNERFFSCSCGAQGAISYKESHCPHCGGELYAGFKVRKVLDGECRYDAWEVQEAGPRRWEFYFHWRALALEPTGEYTFSNITDKCGEFELPYSFKFEARVGTNSRAKLLNHLKNIPEFMMLRTLGNWQLNAITVGHKRVLSCTDYLKYLGEEMNNSGLSMAEMDKDLSLYGIYFAHKVNGTTHKNSLHDYLISQGLNENGVEFVLNLFRNKRKVDYIMTTFVNDETVFKTFCERVQNCMDGKYPNGGFILELLAREVVNIADFTEIMNFFSKMEDEEIVWDNVTRTWVPTNRKMIPDFADFLKKTASRKQNVVSSFIQRVLKLQKLGHPVILENLLDKNYYRLLNSSAYSSKSENFDEEFQKDPLQCLKGMK